MNIDFRPVLRASGWWIGVAALSFSAASLASSQELSSDPPDWIRTGQSRYGWQLLAERYDKNGDGRVASTEVPLSPDVFARIDRDWDGVLTPVDFDWNKESELGKRKETTFALFKMADDNSDGRLTTEEWQSLFERQLGEGTSLNEQQLEELIYRPRIVKAARELSLRKSDSEYSPRSLAAVKVPQPGDMAPDFELASPDSGNKIRLSQFRGQKPVVLVFGCYTCGNYRTYSESLEQMYREWKGEAEFLRVYVREAHPTDEKQAATSTNKRAGIIVKQPDSLQERCAVATQFAAAMQVTTPMVVDDIDNRVGLAYGAWPDRLYIVDRNGKIAFTGGPGPFGFNPREMEQCLAVLLLDQ
jgi:cytochrome oxidase Cu insertion factor (SCO1/SenC/PrrC family)/Ca2+-binding EF-hand superfamily protein